MYECHITIEYVSPEDEQYSELTHLCHGYGFRVAKLYKWNKTTSDLDTFMTGHSDNYEKIKGYMGSLVQSLNALQFKVTRYKIEQILLDSKNGDSI